MKRGGDGRLLPFCKGLAPFLSLLFFLHAPELHSLTVEEKEGSEGGRLKTALLFFSEREPPPEELKELKSSMESILRDSWLYELMPEEIYSGKVKGIRNLLNECGLDVFCFKMNLARYGVTRVLLVRVKGGEGLLDISIHLFDIEKERMLKSQTSRLTEGIKNSKKVAENLLNNLLYSTGILSLKCDVDGATIYLDGKDVGRTPLGKIIGVGPGLHTLKIVAPGLPPFERGVTLTPGGVEEVDVRLKPLIVKVPIEEGDGKGGAFYTKWWFWLMSGFVISSAIGGAIFGHQGMETFPDDDDDTDGKDFGTVSISIPIPPESP